MTRILVTGGAGYIGSHCCKALAAAGFEPVVFDDLSTGHRSFCRWGPLLPGDIRDREALDCAFEALRPAAVIHFAAKSIVPQSVHLPHETYDVNVSGTLNLLAAMVRHGVRDIVFSSTCAVYGMPGAQPISEAAARAPISPYGKSKAMVELLMEDFGAAHGIRSASLRYFNAAGADRDGEIGEQHDPETHLIPIVLDVAMKLRPALMVNGADYDTPDGTAVRDFIHVEDLATAHVAALRRLMAGNDSLQLNVGTGVGTSVADIVASVEEVTGLPVPISEGPRRAGDPAQLVAAPTLACEMLDWRAERDLGTTIEDAWRWHRDMRQSLRAVA